MKSLQEIYDEHNTRLVNKWDNYIGVYENYFSKYRHQPITFLEIGIAHGGSLEIWRKYFGEEATIIGVDVDPETKKFEDGKTTVHIGSQEDREFLNNLKTKIPSIDILLDDGGHTMKQQITTFECLFDHVKDGGLYVCEDLHTSYLHSFGGGYKKKSSFIEYSKNFIDYLHGWHVDGAYKKKMHNALTESILGLHYFTSIVVIEKKKTRAPQNTFKGKEQLKSLLADYGQKVSPLRKMEKNVKAFLVNHKIISPTFKFRPKRSKG